MTQELSKSQYIVNVYEKYVLELKKEIQKENIPALEKVRLEIELLKAITEFNAKKRVLEFSEQRLQQEKSAFDLLSKEVNENLDSLLTIAKGKQNKKEIADIVRLYENAKLEICKDQKSKNDFYLSLKKILF